MAPTWKRAFRRKSSPARRTFHDGAPNARHARLLVAAALAGVPLGSLNRAHAATAAYVAVVATDKPVGHWRFGEASGSSAVDVSASRRSGTYSQGSTHFVFSRLITAGDRGVKFRGSAAKVQIPNPVELSPRRMTLEALFTWHGSTGHEQRIVGRSLPARSADSSYALGLADDGRVLFDITTGSPKRTATDVGIRAGIPAHVVASYDGASARIYVDGRLVKTSTVSGDLAASTSQPLLIGNAEAGNLAFNGTLDELALYSDVVSPQRIEAHAAAALVRQVPVLVNAPAPDTRTGERVLTRYVGDTFPVQLGIPIPEGELYSASQARLLGPDGAEQIVQTKILGRWRKFRASTPSAPETSLPIKWLQVSFNAKVSPASSTTYYLEYGPFVRNPLGRRMVERIGDDYVVNTGAVKFRVNRASPTLFSQAWIDLNGDSKVEDSEALLARASSRKGLYFVDQANQLWLASRDKDAKLELEESGPQQVTLKASGRYRRPGQQSRNDNEWTVRIKAYAGKPFVRVYHTIVFNEASSERRYKDIGIEVPLAKVTSPSVRFAKGSMRPAVHMPDQPEYLDSGLGNQSWNSPRINDRDHELMLHQARHNGYRVYLNDGEVSNHGFHRSGHWFDVSGTSARGPFGITAALRWTWQNYPTAFEWERHVASSDQLLRVHLWTRRAGANETSGPTLLDFRAIPYLESKGRYPASEFGGSGAREIFRDQILYRCSAAPYEIPSGLPAQPGSGLSCAAACMHATGIGVAKTHELTFEFHRDQPVPGTTTSPETAFFLQRPVIAHADPQWVRDSLALGRIHPMNGTFPEIDRRAACTTDRQCGPRKCMRSGQCQNLFDVYMERYLLEQAVDGADRAPFGPTYPLDVPPDGAATRAWGDSYGAFDFGDVLHGGKRAHRYWLHNRYFVPSSFWLWFARSGDRRAFEFGESNARHVMDIDTSHTEYAFEYSCGKPSAYPGKRRVFRGTPRLSNIGAIHWASSGPGAFGCVLRPPPGKGCDPNAERVPLFTAPADYASYLTTYYYLTGYERARDVAAEVAQYIAKMAQRPTEEYWKQTESRGLGGGIQAASDLFALLGDAWLEIAASKTALDLIGMADGGRELAANRVSPPPAFPGLAFGFGRPFDPSWNYMLPGAVAYLRLASENTFPKASDVSRWLQNQASAAGAADVHRWPNKATNYWVGLAAAFHESGNSKVLAVASQEFDAVKSSGWDSLQVPNQRAFTLYGLPYLMDALAAAKAGSIPRRTPLRSNGGELRFEKTTAADVGVTLQARATEYAELPLYLRARLPKPPFSTRLLPPVVSIPRDGKPRLCAAPCSASLIVQGPNGREVARRPYPAAGGSAYARNWYNQGGWLERITLKGPGVYRARVQVDGVQTAKLILKGDRVVGVTDYDKPLFELFLLPDEDGKVKTPSHAANPSAAFSLLSNDAAEEGRTGSANPRRFRFGYGVTENCLAEPTPPSCTVSGPWH